MLSLLDFYKHFLIKILLRYKKIFIIFNLYNKNAKSYIYYNRGIDSTFDGLEIIANPYNTNSSYIVYTLDGTNPICLEGGTSFKYNGKIPRSVLDSYKKEAETTISDGIIIVKSVQCISTSGNQTFKSNISTLILNILSSNIEAGINGIEGTNSNLLGQGMSNLLNGNGLNGSLINGLGNNLGGNAGGPQIGTMNVGPNKNYQTCLEKCYINNQESQEECLARCQDFKTSTDNSNNYTSTDPYANEKLQEINACFVDIYNSHLTNINNSIDKLITEKDKQTEEKAKNKYNRALAKLEEIKRLFILKYSRVINMPNPISLNNTSSGSYIMQK